MGSQKKILVICPNPVGYAPGQRLKYEQYFDSWRQNGYNITVKPFFNEKTQQVIYSKGYFLSKIWGTFLGYVNRFVLLFSIRKYDIVYIFLWVTPIGIPISEWITCKIAKKFIYDIDDLVFLKHREAEPWYAYHLKGRKKPIYLMKHAYHVITCTPFLENYVKQYNVNITNISSTINTQTYIPVNEYNNNKEIVLGWSGSHSTIRMLALLIPVLKELKNHLSFKLLVMGSSSFSIPGIKVEAVEWSEAIEISTLQKMDIGLYPLPVHEEWVKGKSGLKALQYMALGIPTIAAKIGCNDQVIENGVSGFLASTDKEWIDNILLLANDPSLRKQIGIAGRLRVEQYYSIDKTKSVYLSILNSV